VNCENLQILSKRHHNNLKTLNFDGVLRIAPKAPKDNDDFIFIEAMGLWKNSKKFRRLYSRLALYLSKIHQTPQKQKD
jgi:hypothetical protein